MNNYVSQLTNEFSEIISSEVYNFFQKNEVLQVCKNSSGNYYAVLKKIKVKDGAVDVKATFILISSNNYKCTLELLNFPKILDGKVKLTNKYQGTLILYSLHEQPKSINILK